METHSGDSPVNRFFSFWGALVIFLCFGVLALIGIMLESTLLASPRENPDDVRRTALDTATLTQQAELVNRWQKNEDGTYEVPVDVALPQLTDKLPRPSKSAVPVPGTPAAEEAAAAAGMPSSGNETENP